MARGRSRGEVKEEEEGGGWRAASAEAVESDEAEEGEVPEVDKVSWWMEMERGGRRLALALTSGPISSPSSSSSS